MPGHLPPRHDRATRAARALGQRIPAVAVFIFLRANSANSSNRSECLLNQRLAVGVAARTGIPIGPNSFWVPRSLRRVAAVGEPDVAGRLARCPAVEVPPLPSTPIAP